jgi:hypothetical protein
MFFRPKSPAPEPYFSGALYLLYRVSLFIRNDTAKISPEQLSDLGDAIHNVPESLTEYGDFFDEQKIRDMYLGAYDLKWATSPDSFNLQKTLDQGIAQAARWLDENGST